MLAAFLAAIAVGTVSTPAAASSPAGSRITPHDFVAQFVQLGSGKCADYEPLSGAIEIDPCMGTGNPNRSFQLFVVSYREDLGASTIRSVAAGKCLTTDGVEPQTFVSLDACLSLDPHQLWVAYSGRFGGFFLKQMQSGLYLDTAFGDVNNGTPMVIGKFTESLTQQWDFEPAATSPRMRSHRDDQ